MPLPVQLQKVVDEMSMGDEWEAYVNRTTGELVSFPSAVGELMYGKIDDDESSAEDRETVLASDDYIQLPSKFDIHEYSIMERFCATWDDEKLRGRLLSAIKGRGAFRRFKDFVHEHSIHDAWYRFRDDALKKIAADFLRANDIPYVDGTAA
jgi:hypothetical protein